MAMHTTHHVLNKMMKLSNLQILHTDYEILKACCRQLQNFLPWGSSQVSYVCDDWNIPIPHASVFPPTIQQNNVLKNEMDKA